MSIEVHHLRKSFGAVEAVRDITFDVTTGSLFAFVGRNGAGKSTTIGCLTTSIEPDAGELVIDGHRVGSENAAIRRSIGVVFQDSVLDPLLTVRENLAMRAAAYGMHATALESRIGELSHLLHLGDFLDRRYAKLSGGQRRRTDVARALMHRPRVLFLDEPTAGLDPLSREQVWGTIGALREDGNLTVFLTTHYMEETERADRVCIIDEGRLLVQGTPPQLRREYSSSVLTLSVSDPDKAAARIRSVGGVPIVSADSGLITVAVADSSTARSMMGALGDELLDFEFRHGTMDDVFLSVTGMKADAA